MPIFNLLTLSRKSTSCNYGSFCKRSRCQTSPTPIPRPSVASDMRVVNQPLAIMALFARGAAARLRQPPFHDPRWPPTCALPLNLLPLCHFLQEVPPPDFANPHPTALRGLRHARSQSTSCKFAAFCKRCRRQTSPTPIPPPSVASDMCVANQPLAFSPLFAIGELFSRLKLCDLPDFPGFLWQVGPFQGQNAVTCTFLI